MTEYHTLYGFEHFEYSSDVMNVNIVNTGLRSTHAILRQRHSQSH